MKNLTSYLDTLSESEKKQHQELIQECLLRESDIINSCNTTKQKLQEFIISMDKVVNSLNILQTEADKLQESVSNLYLAQIPNDKCFNA
jgi:esterase/lipase